MGTEYEELKRQIQENPELLINPEIKEKIIGGLDESIFLDFIPNKISLDAFQNLFDEEGIAILGKDFFVENKIKNLMTIPPNAVAEYLFSQFSFCKIVQEHMGNLRICFRNNATEKCAISFMKYILENEQSEVTTVYFFVIPKKFQLPILKSLKVPFDLIRRIITVKSSMNYNFDAVTYLIEENPCITTLTDFTIEEMFDILENTSHLPEYLMSEKRLVGLLASMDSIKNYRLLVEKMRENYDVSMIEKVRKKYYDREISGFLVEENMLSRYFQFYQELMEHKNKAPREGNDVDFINSLIDKYFVFSEKRNRNIFYTNIHGIEFRSRVIATYHANSLRKFLEEESHRQLTNMVIDYHYEDIPYNLFLDLRQLLHFQKDCKTLSDKEIEFYAKLLEMDNMSYEELQALHERLKSFPVMEKLYDDFRTAKDKAISFMNESVLNEESIQQYKNNELSEQYGIDIYVLDGDDFSAYIRGYDIPKTDSLLVNPVRHDTDRNSYSLVGSSQLGTFFSPKEYFNFIYLTPMPVDQVAHICSGPSYSVSYERNVTSPSPWLYELCTPKSLLDTRDEYTEIVVIVPNDTRDDELNSKLVHPKLFGLFCYDEVTAFDVRNAKHTGNSIVLVKTKSYENKKSQIPRRVKKYINQIEDDEMKDRKIK